MGRLTTLSWLVDWIGKEPWSTCSFTQTSFQSTQRLSRFIASGIGVERGPEYNRLLVAIGVDRSFVDRSVSRRYAHVRGPSLPSAGQIVIDLGRSLRPGFFTSEVFRHRFVPLPSSRLC